MTAAHPVCSMFKVVGLIGVQPADCMRCDIRIHCQHMLGNVKCLVSPHCLQALTHASLFQPTVLPGCQQATLDTGNFQVQETLNMEISPNVSMSPSSWKLKYTSNLHCSLKQLSRYSVPHLHVTVS